MQTHSASEAITYIIPTFNRPAFLRRLLLFFRDAELKRPIIIVDSSSLPQAAESRSVFEEFRSELNVSYVHVELPIVEKCCDALRRVRTEFVAFCADDDFQVPAAVNECVEFLSRNPDYSVALGRVVHAGNVHSRNSREYECELTDATDIEQGCAAERLLSMARKPYSTFYGIHRTAVLAEQFELARCHTDYRAARVFTESLLIGLSAVAGRIKILTEVQYIQQTHGTNESVLLSRIENRARRQELYQRYHAALIDYLIARTPFSKEQAADVVDRSVNLVPGMSRKESFTFMFHRKIAREITRLWVRLSRFRQRLTGSSASGGQIIIRNAALIPNEGQYAIALRLLIEHPTGFTR